MLPLLTRTLLPSGLAAANYSRQRTGLSSLFPLPAITPRLTHRAPLLLGALLGVLLPLAAAGRAAASTPEALQLLDRLEERIAQFKDYQFLVSSFERKGDQREQRCYRLFVKDQRMVRIKVV